MSLRGHAGDIMGMSQGVESLQTSTPAATRNTVPVTVESHWCTVVTGIENRRRNMFLFLLPASRSLSSSLWKILTITQLAKERRVLQNPRLKYGRARFQLRASGLTLSMLSGADVLFHCSGINLLLPRVFLNTQRIPGNLD